MADRDPDPDPFAPSRLRARGLDQRQAEILVLIARGHTNAEIAERMHLSAETIKKQVSRILEQLGARTRAEAVAVAVGSAEGDGPR